MSRINPAVRVPVEWNRASMQDIIAEMVRAMNQAYDGAPEGRAVRAAAPTGGTWGRGQIIWNSEPSAAGYVGWVCVTGGSPGTWKGFGAIEA